MPPEPPSRLDELTARARRIVGARPTPEPPDATREAPAPRDADRGDRLADSSPPDTGAPGGPEGSGGTFLGIDPGTATTGYGFVRPLPGEEGRYLPVAFGVVETAPDTPMPQRLLTLYRALRALIAAHHPTAAAVEKLFFGRNATTAIGVGQARGVALLALAEAGLPVAEYTPAEVKQALAGFGRAQKPQMQRMTQALLDLPTAPQPDDAADALAVAICHLRRSRLRAAGLR